MQATDYKLQFNGTDWTITRSDKTSFTMAPDASGNLSFDGLSVNVTGSANAKDSFIVKPVSDVIVNMELKFKDESKLAMASASNGGESDNRNGQNCSICKTVRLLAAIRLSTMPMLPSSVRSAAQPPR